MRGKGPHLIRITNPNLLHCQQNAHGQPPQVHLVVPHQRLVKVVESIHGLAPAVVEGAKVAAVAVSREPRVGLGVAEQMEAGVVTAKRKALIEKSNQI